MSDTPDIVEMLNKNSILAGEDGLPVYAEVMHDAAHVLEETRDWLKEAEAKLERAENCYHPDCSLEHAGQLAAKLQRAEAVIEAARQWDRETNDPSWVPLSQELRDDMDWWELNLHDAIQAYDSEDG